MSGTKPTWARDDEALATRLVGSDVHGEAALRRARDAGLPAIDVSVNLGKMLMMLAQIAGASRVLEIGTLGGYSTLWLARAVGPEGRVITLEIDPHHADVARASLADAGFAGRVEVREGDAKDSLAALAFEDTEPFDFVFIDADKESYPDYLSGVLELSRPGTVIVADNVVRGGAVFDETQDSPVLTGVRRFLDMCDDPRISAVGLPTVGTKGYDGFALLRVLA